MAKTGGTPRRPARTPRGGRSGASGSSGSAKKQVVKKASRRPADTPAPPALTASSVFRLGAIPGATPGKWIDAWEDRTPARLELVPLDVADQRAALVDGLVDAAIVRLPIDADGLHVIPLYDEVPVVVTSSESHLTAAEELAPDDLVGEVLVTPGDDVLHPALPGTVSPSFPPPPATADAIATVAAGVGIVVVPMSLARLHQRKDAAYRPLRDGPVSTVALAWMAERTTPAVDLFVGIVRGRTANSSRG